MERVRVEGADGVGLSVVDWGGGGPPILLVHGFGHHARLWDPLVRDLRGPYRVLALDSRGHGESDADPAFRYHNAAIARDVAAVAEGLSLEHLTLVGHSQGGHACLRVAGRDPGRVARLVLIDAGPDIPGRAAGTDAAHGAKLLAPRFPSVEAYAALLAEAYPRLDDATRRALAETSLRRTPDGALALRLDERFLRRDARRDGPRRPGFDRDAWAAKENERIWHYLGRVRCPTLVVRGEHSPLLSAATARRMQTEGLRDGRAVEIAGAGHVPMLEAPAAFRRALLHFLEVAPSAPDR